MGGQNSGRKKSLRTLAQEELHRALNKVAMEKAKRADGVAYFLEHYIKKAFASDTMLNSLAQKLVPNLSDTKTEHDGKPAIQLVSVTYEILDGNKIRVAQSANGGMALPGPMEGISRRPQIREDATGDSRIDEEGTRPA